ncbi:hypothetical protein ACFEMC_09020 [Kineococcus sp. DHX-1]|uniref:pilus assembly PilX family protein n=1 Tax=Kineococcus sp. DHX-1 TaxID=3349638 RepID=UPI0036D386BB
MRLFFARLRVSRSGDDEGVALITVLGAMVAMTLFAMVALTLALQNSTPSRTDQDRKIALAAAQAGIDDFISRLNANDTYYQNQGNDASNPAFTTGRTIQGTGTSGGSFTYRLLSSNSYTASTQRIVLEVTGKSRNVTQTLTAQMKPNSFLNFIYFTDLEQSDPDLVGANAPAIVNGNSYVYYNNRYYYVYADPSAVNDLCSGRYYYQGRTSVSYSTSSGAYKLYGVPTTGGSKVQINGNYTVSGFCSEIQWVSNDVIRGPLHSNDALQINGNTLFADKRVETGYGYTGNGYSNASPATSKSGWWWGSQNVINPGTQAQPGYTPKPTRPIVMPQDNTEVKTVAAQTGTGCYYIGSTKITFNGSAMNVSGTSTNNPVGCVGSNLPIPSVIYVADNALAVCNGQNVAGFPLSGEYVGQNYLGPDYSCQKGTAYVSGTINGLTTVNAETDVVITGNISYVANTQSVLGLVANQRVWVSHPIKNADQTQDLLSSSNQVTSVSAAILALKHSFLVQNYNQGTRYYTALSTPSNLSVYGTIAQKYRGPVGTSSSDNNGTFRTGYQKNYVYDTRLPGLPPPYFLKPEESPWNLDTTSDG